MVISHSYYIIEKPIWLYCAGSNFFFKILELTPANMTNHQDGPQFSLPNQIITQDKTE